MFRAAILTISDTAYRTPSTDGSGPRIEQLLSLKGIFEVPVQRDTVPDERDAIKAAVRRWSEAEKDVPDLILTTGGTGFGERDVTPEALTPLIERHAPGIVHLLLMTSFNKTPMAALSRPVAGTHRRSLIVTLPGSIKAVAENMEALLQGAVLSHALDLIRGGSGRDVHAQMQSERGIGIPRPSSQSDLGAHHHHHHHHHHAPTPRSYQSYDPSKPVTERHRVSQYSMLSLEEAFRAIEDNTSPLNFETRKVDYALSNYILAEDVYASQNIPSRTTTSIDGYAAKGPVKPGRYRVLTPSTHPPSSLVPAGSVYRINTGAPLPPGTDTAVMVEDTEVVETYDDEHLGKEEAVIRILADIPVNDNIREPGSDVRSGDRVLSKGALLGFGGGEIGTLSFVGRTEARVYAKPKVAIMSTGDELQDLQGLHASTSGDFSGIYDTNRPSLTCLLKSLGYEVIDLGIVKDDMASHEAAFAKGLADADLLLTTGGSSMGSTDLIKPVIERKFDGTIHFGRVAMKPGKPTTFATIDVGGKRKPVFALPGNPASALVTMYLFVIPALRLLGGWERKFAHLPRIPVKIDCDMRLDPRPEFHRVTIRREGDGLVASSTGGQRSSRAGSLAGANGLVALPGKTDATGPSVPKGTVLDVVLIGEIHPSI